MLPAPHPAEILSSPQIGRSSSFRGPLGVRSFHYFTCLGTTASLQSTPQGNHRSREQGEAVAPSANLQPVTLDQALKGEAASERQNLATS